MLKTTRRGADLADVAALMSDVPRRVLPYATATALTRTAKLGQAGVLNEMRTSFDRPTAYTLNSTFVVPATKNTLSTRVGIKNQPGANTRPENFLGPQVFGGVRREKRFEAALRYAGFMKPGQAAMPGRGARLDANGNVSTTEIRQVLTALQGVRGANKRRLKNSLFVGRPAGGNRPDGVWRREGKRLRAVFVFTDQLPKYGARLDFFGTVQKVVLSRFQIEFNRAVSDLGARGIA